MGNQGKSTSQSIHVFNCCSSFYVCQHSCDPRAQMQLPSCRLFKEASVRLPAGRQSRVDKNQPPRGHVGHRGATPGPADANRGQEKEASMRELLVYMCFELRLIHNQKAINLQRPPNYFSNIITNKCITLVGRLRWHREVFVEVVCGAPGCRLG